MVHITDCHVYNNNKVIASMKKLFADLHALDTRPHFIINTGDSIYDANFKKRNVVEKEWKAWEEVTRDVGIPLYNILGNHDVFFPPVFGFLNKIYTPFPDHELAMQALKMTKAYYSFVQSGWKFIGLNSISKRYSLDDEQFKWLTNEVATAKENICIFSHVPVLSIASFIYHLRKKRWSAFPLREMHGDVFKLQKLFAQYKNVKLCLSGHVHYMDDVVYNGVLYLCGGAVCGNWWKGPLAEFPPAYSILDLYEDGSIKKRVFDLDYQ